MWNYRARWKFIGVELGIDMGTLDAIEKDCRIVDDCLLRMIKDWLRNSPRPTREVIRAALQSKHVSNAAGNLHQSIARSMQKFIDFRSSLAHSACYNYSSLLSQHLIMCIIILIQ